MKKFDYKLKVIVKGEDVEKEHLPLVGKIGTVHRIRMSDAGAWIRFDEELPRELQSFPDKDDNRHNDVVLFPWECEPYEDIL